MPASNPSRELGESRLHVLDGGSQVWRSPLFLLEDHCLLFFQTWDLSRTPPTTEPPPNSRRFVSAIAQQVDGDWQPLHITGSGGGGSDERMVHWIELELPDDHASAIRISYADPVLDAIDDRFAIGR